MLLFGYMDLMIFVKWLTNFSGRENAAPSVIASMINMFLNGGVVEESIDPLFGTRGT